MNLSPRLARAILPVAAVAALGPAAGVAQAKPVKVTGEQTTVALSSAATQALAAAGVTVAPLAPATATPAGLSFPVSGGRLNATTQRGFVLHRGGVSLTKAGKTLRLRRPIVRVTGAGGFLSVRLQRRECQVRRLVRFVRNHTGKRHVVREVVRFVRHHCRGHHGPRIRAFTLSGIQRADQSGKVVVTANLALTQRAANLLNRAFGTSFAAGAAAGSATATLTVAP